MLPATARGDASLHQLLDPIIWRKYVTSRRCGVRTELMCVNAVTVCVGMRMEAAARRLT
jgi:hypothetical protein